MMFITILLIGMSPLNSLRNIRIYYIRQPLIVNENLRPPHTLSGNKNVNTVSHGGIQRNYLVILYLQNALRNHSSCENVVLFIPMRKFMPLFFQFSRNSQRLRQGARRSLIVHFSQKGNKCGQSGQKCIFFQK